MVKPNANASSKSVWAQFGRGTRDRDVESPSALRHGIHVSEHVEANAIHKTSTRLVEFTPQGRDNLPERPRTSAGPASSAKRRKAEKRVTQDDLLFNPLAVHGKGTTFYNFPLPGSLPTPASSPKATSPTTPEKSPLTRPSTPDSMEAASASLQTQATASMEVSQTQIGMALGSPGHIPIWHQGPANVHSSSPSPDQMESANENWSNSPRAVKQKNKGWKLFGGLFGAKKPAPSTAFYQVQPEGTVRTVVEAEPVFTDPPTSNEKKPVKTRDRGRSMSQRRAKKDTLDAETAPLQFSFQTPRPTPAITLEGQVLVDDGSKPMQKKGKSLLDVDIPDVHMERYSVMFSSVLGKSTNTSSSLLARRQATLDKLKTVHETLAEKEQELDEKAKQLKARRATSPQFRHSQSPAFSLFPSTPSRRDQSPSRQRNPSSLRRSNTSPAALSPSCPTFAPGLGNKAHATMMNEATHATRNERSDSTLSTRSKKDGAKLASLNTSLKSKKWSLEESHLMLDSQSNIEVNVVQEDVYDPAPSTTKPKLAETHWQLINSPHTHATAASVSESSTSTSSSEHSTSTTASSVSIPQSAGSIISRPLKIQSPPLSSGSRPRAATLVAQREIPKPRSRSATCTANAAAEHEEDEQEARLKGATDVSIATQISVSRQQLQLLMPIKTTVKRSGSVRKARENLAKGERTIGGQSFPVPAGGLATATIDIAHASSPLGVVAVAAHTDHDPAATPLSERAERQRLTLKTRRENKEGTERLVEGVKPSTPTLMVVGGDQDERGEQWAGATATVKTSIAERRKLKESNAKGLTPVVGQTRVGLSVQSAVRGNSYTDTQHRKSERVVVENMS